MFPCTFSLHSPPTLFPPPPSFPLRRAIILTREGGAGEERAVPHGELDLDVHAVGGAALDEGRPQPVVHVVVGDVAHHVRPPVDAILELREALLNPLRTETENKK